VRELRNAVRRLLVTPERPLDDSMGASAPPRHAPHTEGVLSLPVARREAMDAFERAYLAQILARADGNVTRAATVADVSRQMIQKLIRKHGTGNSNEP
jgi:DNA-binding NtrC family response regulator